MKIILFLLLISTSAFAGFTQFGTPSIYNIVPKVADNVNDFSFIFNTLDGAVSKSSGDIVTSCTHSATGNAVCSFTGLTVEPALTCNTVLDDHYVSYSSVTNTSANIVIRNSSGVNDQDAYVHCIGKKNEADSKMPMIQPVLVPRNSLYNNTTGLVAASVDGSNNLTVSGNVVSNNLTVNGPFTLASSTSYFNKDSGELNVLLNMYSGGDSVRTGYFYQADSNKTLRISSDGGVQLDDAGGVGGNVPHNCHVVGVSGSGTTVTASCSSGEFLTGGGCQGAGSISQSISSSALAWSCTFTTSGANYAKSYCCDY